MENQDHLETFVTKLLEEKGVLELVDEATRQELVTSMKQQLEEIINRNLIDELDDDSLAEFSTLIDQDATTEVINKFFVDKNIDTNRVTARSLQQFRDAYIKSS